MSRIYVDKMPEKPSDCPFCSDDGVTLKCCKIMGNKHACDLETGLDCDYLAELPKDLKPERIIVEPPQLNGMKQEDSEQCQIGARAISDSEESRKTSRGF